MSIKKTNLTPSNGAEAINRNDANDEVNHGKAVKSFEAALAEVAGQIDAAGETQNINTQTQTELQKIALSLNLNSSDEAMSAVRQSARFIVSSRLDEKMRETEQGKKLTNEISEFISNDPFIYRKLLAILKRLIYVNQE